MGAYDDMIYLPHPEPKRHKRMSREARAAQFAPFAALTGYEELVNETSRYTSKRPELDEDQKKILNEKIRILVQEGGIGVFTVFEEDKKKEGGALVKITGRIEKLDNLHGTILLSGKEEFQIADLYEISL